MKKILMLAVLGLFVSAASGLAQTIYDGAKLTGKDLNGTARFVGMGGAMGALGGDISTIGTNPAGIGLYRSSDIMTSFGFSSYGSESKYLGSKWNSDKNRASFDNIGFVFSSKIGNTTPLRYVNFGFNYHKAKSFYKNMEMNGDLGNYSQAFLMASQADGISNWGNPFDTNDIGWLSAVGYEGYVISPSLTTTQNEFPYKDKEGNQVVNNEGKPLFYDYDYYNTIVPDGVSPYARFHSEERGGIDQYDFNIAFNFSDRFYLGLTIGAYSVDYNKYTSYDEDYGNETGYKLQGWNKITGSGFDFKFGAILRPFEYSLSV